MFIKTTLDNSHTVLVNIDNTACIFAKDKRIVALIPPYEDELCLGSFPNRESAQKRLNDIFAAIVCNEKTFVL